MKQPVFAILICCCFLHAPAQYYLRGQVNDEKGTPLQNAKIYLSSQAGYMYHTGYSGAFGIPSSRLQDTITISLDGYITLIQPVTSSKYQTLILKAFADNESVTRNHLLSLTKDFSRSINPQVTVENGETYSNIVENNFISAQQYPETGFALNIDRASYSNIRRFINGGGMVPPDAVRIEEMLNYFDFGKAGTDTLHHLFQCSTKLTSTPWKSKNELFFVKLQAPTLDLKNVPPGNFIFLIDVSGSMDEPNRLPLLQSAFKLLVKNLRQQDSVAIIVYGGTVGILLQPTSGNNKQKIINVIDSLTAQGDTPGEAAIQTAYSLAERSFNKNANNRIILATDGDFNVGQTSEKDLEDLIEKNKQTGIYLTCLGVGMGNYKDSKLEALATKGNGNFAYLDNIEEAQKVLIREFTKTMYAVADDASLSVKFNPAYVKSYRLIGFDNKKDALADSSSGLAGGEVGSGHSLMAVFEIIPADQTQRNPSFDSSADFANLILHYKLPDQDTVHSQYFSAPFGYRKIETADSSLRLAASICMFGELLRQSRFSGSYTWEDAEKTATSAVNPEDISQKEYLDLLRQARKIYAPYTKHRKKNDD